MVFAVGQLDERVTIRRYTEANDTSAQPTQTFKVLATVFADVQEMSGQEAVFANQPIGLDPRVVTIRHFPGLTRLDKIVRKDGTVLNIKSIAKSRPRQRTMELLCTEQT